MIKLGTKVKIVGGPASIKGKTGFVGEIRHGMYKGAPKVYTIDLTGGSSVQLKKEDIRQLKESEIMATPSLLEQVISEFGSRTSESSRSGYTEYDSSKEYYDDFDEWVRESRKCGCKVKHDPDRGLFVAVDRSGKPMGKWTKHNSEGYITSRSMAQENTRQDYRQHYNDANRYTRTRQDAEVRRQPQRDTRWSEDPIAAATDRLHSLFSRKRVEETEQDDMQQQQQEQPPRDEPQQQQETKHIVGVMIQDTDSQAVSQRGEGIQRKIKVGGTTEQEAIARARAYYKKSGYKVLDAWYIKPLADDGQQQQQSFQRRDDNRSQQFRGTGGLPPTDDNGDNLYR